MRCDDVRPRLEEFHDGELAGADAAAVQEHVATCAGCAGELESLRRLEGVLKGASIAARPEWDRFASSVHERVNSSRRSRWFAIVPLAAAAALTIALLPRLNWFVVAPPVDDTAALVDEFNGATDEKQKEEIESKIQKRGPRAVAMLQKLVRDPSPKRQAAAGLLLARHPDESAREWLRTNATGQEDTGDWELREIGVEPTDDELIGAAFDLARSPKTRDEALRILRKLDWSARNRQAHDAIVQRVKGLLASGSPSDQELGLMIADDVNLVLLLPDLVDLLEAPVLGDKALSLLRERTGKDYGRDKDAWRRFFSGRM